MSRYLHNIANDNINTDSRVNYEMRRSGHKFIELIFTSDKDYSFFEIGGVEVLQPIEYTERNRTKYKFKETGGVIKFKPDPLRGGYPVCKLLDTPHNRKILATHYDPDVWEIDDDQIDQKIRELRTKMANSMKEVDEEEEKFQKELEDINDAIIAAETQKEKNQLTKKIFNMVSERGKKKKAKKAERKRTSFPKPPKTKAPRNQKNKVSDMVEIDEH